MAHRTLIVARMNPTDADAVAELFGKSDSTELPHLIGATRRTLFQFHGLYFHLVESDETITPDLYRAQQHPLYTEINEGLKAYMTPYDPAWREPKDSMAKPFYVWESDRG